MVFRARPAWPCLVITDREQSLLIEHYCPGSQLHPVPLTFIIKQSYLPSHWSSQPVPGSHWSVVAAPSHHPDLTRQLELCAMETPGGPVQFLFLNWRS